MNAKIMQAMGFGKEVAAKERGECPFCGKKLTDETPAKGKAKNEPQISGLCRSCVSSAFKSKKKKSVLKED